MRWPALSYKEESTHPQGAQNIFNISYDNQMCSCLSRLYLVAFNISWRTTIKAVFVIQLEFCSRQCQQFEKWCKTRRTLVICSCLWKTRYTVPAQLLQLLFIGQRGVLRLSDEPVLAVNHSCCLKGLDEGFLWALLQSQDRGHSWDSTSQSFTLHSPQLRTGTQGSSVLFLPSWSCLPSPCFCRGGSVRGFLVSISPLCVSLAVHIPVE